MVGQGNFGLAPSGSEFLPRIDLASPLMAAMNIEHSLPMPALESLDGFWNDWHQLIILGNGFDLECELASRFEDFYIPRRALLFPSHEEICESGEKNWGTYIYSKGMTVWDLILQSNVEDSWNDIERAIAQWVLPRTGSLSRYPFGKVLSYLQKWMKTTSVIERSRYETYQGRTIHDPETDIARYILNVTSSKNMEWNRQSLLDFSLKELCRLETAFSIYLSKQVDSVGQYREKAGKLLEEICVREAPPEDEFNVSTSVLDFNYTSPSLPSHASKNFDLVNIHGSLEGKIVFGIDGKDYMDDFDVVPFTKTYRLLALDSVKARKLFYSPGFGAIDKSSDVIKFYGHSLGEPDYSYFQSIFDAVNLYGSHTRLIFYYRSHGSSGSEEERLRSAQQRMFRSVANLLSSYGSTMDNLDHGKNLMHKLLLEGRLSVEFLPALSDR